MAPTVKRPFSIRSHQRLARILALAVVLVALFTGYLVRYHFYLASLRGFDVAEQPGFAEQAFPLLNRDQITQLGMAHREDHRPRSSYTLLACQKPADVVRIGIFGCSFVYGSEAGSGQDFPSQLERIFNAEGGPRIEVLNFGVGAFGVQQSYLLWQYLAGDFELDATVYNLYGFHRQRDNSFVMLNTIFAPVHARYVLDGEGLRLIRVHGGDRGEAARGYFRLIPRWDYLRFDAKTPPQIRALLPRGSELPTNPFYYRSDEEAETVEIYGRIFGRMAAHSDRFVVLLNDRTSEELVAPSSQARSFDSARTRSEKFTWDRCGLYRAPKNHPSALGYRILASETHAILTGDRETVFPDIEIGGPLDATGPDAVAKGLSDFDEVFLSLSGVPAAVFVTSTADRVVQPYSFKVNRTDSIIDISGSRQPLFIAVEGAMSEDDLRLKFSIDGSPELIAIGRVVPTGSPHVGVLKPLRETAGGDGWVLNLRPQESAIAMDLVSERSITDIRLEVGGVTILQGEVHQGEDSKTHQISWRSAEGTLVATRGHPEQDADALISAGGGDVCIIARSIDDAEESWCLRRWRLETTAGQDFNSRSSSDKLSQQVMATAATAAVIAVRAYRPQDAIRHR